MNKNWFKDVFGFDEMKESHSEHITIKDSKLLTKENSYEIGKLSVLSLKEYRELLRPIPVLTFGALKVNQVLGDVSQYHKDENNAGAMFQVASQFNLLEMTSPRITPQDGITRYVYDMTQGPICAMACPAGTYYRNYHTNINTLRNVETLFGEKYWRMENGYALFEEYQLDNLNKIIQNYEHQIMDNLEIGVQWDTEVVPSENKHTVSQAYCSALPILYHDIDIDKFEPLARLILESLYHSTFIASILNSKSNKLFLTLVGAGAFGNKKEWVLDAIEKCLYTYKNFDIDVNIITYGGRPDYEITNMINDFKNRKQYSDENKR